eukprot:Selendium_serpulae@DN6322_c0_g1_i10.p1
MKESEAEEEIQKDQQVDQPIKEVPAEVPQVGEAAAKSVSDKSLPDEGLEREIEVGKAGSSPSTPREKRSDLGEVLPVEKKESEAEEEIQKDQQVDQPIEEMPVEVAQVEEAPAKESVADQSQSVGVSELEVEIIGAKDLVNGADFGLTDSYCEMKWKDQTVKTGAGSGDLSPTWNHQGVIKVNPEKGNVMSFEVLGRTPEAADDVSIGKSQVDVNDVLKELTESGDDQLVKWINLDDTWSGTLGLRFEKTDTDGLAELGKWIDRAREEDAEDLETALVFFRAPSQENPAKQNSAETVDDREQAADQRSPADGRRVQIEVIGARALVRPDAAAKVNPYCEISWRQQTVKTAVVEDHVNPTWKYCDVIHVGLDNADVLSFAIFGYNPFGDDSFLGQACFNPNEALETLLKSEEEAKAGEGVFEKWVSLDDTSSGTVGLRLQLAKDELRNTEEAADGAADLEAHNADLCYFLPSPFINAPRVPGAREYYMTSLIVSQPPEQQRGNTLFNISSHHTLNDDPQVDDPAQ